MSPTGPAPVITTFFLVLDNEIGSLYSLFSAICDSKNKIREKHTLYYRWQYFPEKLNFVDFCVTGMIYAYRSDLLQR